MAAREEIAPYVLKDRLSGHRRGLLTGRYRTELSRPCRIEMCRTEMYRRDPRRRDRHRG